MTPIDTRRFPGVYRRGANYIRKFGDGTLRRLKPLQREDSWFLPLVDRNSQDFGRLEVNPPVTDDDASLVPSAGNVWEATVGLYVYEAPVRFLGSAVSAFNAGLPTTYGRHGSGSVYRDWSWKDKR